MAVKRMTAALLAFCMLLSLGACGRQNAETTAPETTEPATEPPTQPATTQSARDIIGLKINPVTRIEPDFAVLSAFPEYSSDFYSSDGFQINLPRRDLSALDLSAHADALLHSVFDTMTVWPETLPEGFAPDEIIERGKDPGLDIRTLHEMGIDGRGVSIGIIDGPLLLEHTEYSLGSWEKPNYEGHKDGILFPMDSRSFASWAGENEYCWTWMGGWSWVMPYVTGLYALCAQLYPDLTYELFFGGLSATADTLMVDNLGESVPIILVNPRALAEYIQKTIS